MTSAVDALARRLAGGSFFLASALATYAQSEDLDDRGLAETLGCAVEALGPLRLCRRPRSPANLFREDVRKIAARFGVRPEILAEAVRRSDVLARLREATMEGEAGVLMAARDRRDEESDDAPEGEDA